MSANELMDGTIILDGLEITLFDAINMLDNTEKQELIHQIEENMEINFDADEDVISGLSD